MKRKKISAYTLQELVERKNKLKMVYAILGGFMVLAVPVLCYVAYSTKNIALFVVAIGGLNAFAPGLISISQINKEIRMRRETQV